MAEAIRFERMDLFIVTGFQDQLIRPTLTNFHWLQMRESNKPLFLGYEPSEITVSLSCDICKVLVIHGVSTDSAPVGLKSYTSYDFLVDPTGLEPAKTSSLQGKQSTN